MLGIGSSARLCTLLGATMTLCVIAGCRTYDIEPAVDYYRAGNLAAALADVQDPPFTRGHYAHDQLLWLLEEGKLLQDLGRFEESADKLAAAMEKFRYIEEQQASVSVSEELRVVLQGLIWMEYRANFALGVHANTMLALSDLAAGRPDNARASTVEAYNWQLEIEARRQKELDRASEVGKQKKLDQAELISQNQSTLAARYLDDAFMNSAYLSPKHDYLNPFAIFVSALMKIINNDMNGAETDLRLAEEVVPNPYMAQLRDGSLDPRGDTVYVLLERGMAPRRVEESIVLPTPHLGITRVSWPRLQFAPREVSHVEVATSAGEVFPTKPLASFDRIVATQFRHDLPGILTRTIIATAVREGASQAVQHSKADENVKAGLNILAQIWKAATSATDLRTWRFAGSEYQLAAFPRPADGQLDFNLMSTFGQPARTVQLQVGPSAVTVVYIRSIGTKTFNVSAIHGGAHAAEDTAPEPTP